MLIFPDLRLIYICVPATGSTSFIQAMTKVWPNREEKIIRGVIQAKLINDIRMQNHFTAEQCKMFTDSKIWKNYEKIGFVRSPIDWAKSIYRKTGVEQSLGINTQGSFQTYIENLKKTPYTWFTDQKGNIIIDTIYRMEDINAVCEKYLVSAMHINPAATKRKIIVTSKAKSIIKEKFQREYKHYD